MYPTSQHADCYGLCVFSQQIGLGYSGQREVTGHVPAQLPVAPLQEPHGHRDSQHHDRRTTVVLQRHVIGEETLCSRRHSHSKYLFSNILRDMPATGQSSTRPQIKCFRFCKVSMIGNHCNFEQGDTERAHSQRNQSDLN